MSRPALRRVFAVIALVLGTTAMLADAAPRERRPSRREQVALVPAGVTIGHESRVYRRTPQGELSLHMSLPPAAARAERRPAIVFFFGGGWKSGSASQFLSQADYFASRGMVAACADYRIASIHGTTPDACVEDAKAAVRWLRDHAADFQIDPDRIVAAGGSAGGHLAACTALVPGFEPQDAAVSSRPNALLLFNPALNIDELVRQRRATPPIPMEVVEAITPNRFVAAGAPPAAIFFGTDDPLLAGADAYLAKAGPLGLRAELWIAEGQPHGFFNRSPWIQVTARKADEFLASLGYLDGPPTLALPVDPPDLVRRGAPPK